MPPLPLLISSNSVNVQRIGNRFDKDGKWVGTGAGCNGGIYRWYGKSSSIESILSQVLDGQESSVNESAVSTTAPAPQKNESIIQVMWIVLHGTNQRRLLALMGCPCCDGMLP